MAKVPSYNESKLDQESSVSKTIFIGQGGANFPGRLFSAVYEQGVCTVLLFAVLKLVLDGIYAILPDWDIQGQLATFNIDSEGVDLITAHYADVPPWAMILHWLGRYDVFLPVREMYQLTVFAVAGYGFVWAFYYLWKFIKTLRGAG